MKVSSSHPTQHLMLDKVVVDPALARRLPPALAFRYHALPIAKDNSHLTVVIADPNDQRACEAIAASLGVKPYLVQADPVAIDKRLAEIWPDETQHVPLHMLVCHQASPIADEVKAYAQYLGDLLDGQLSYSPTETEGGINFDDLGEKASRGYDLVVFGEPDQPLVKRLFSGPAGCQATERLPTSVLIARQPRWPLKKILLVTRGYETDNIAVDWLVRLAQPSKTVATVLALVPASAAMYQHAVTYMPYGLADWLATDTPLGRQLRRITQQLVNWEVEGTLRFRQGSPSQQIQREVAEGNYDLITVAADSPDWWLRRLLGEVVNPLLHWADRPVLIARPTTV
jgi:nucleotide-binding universal stress UspA family protein